MSETRFPSSSPPSAGSGAGGGERPLIQNALVTQAPSAITEGTAGKTLLLQGRVTGHHPQRGETVISTPKGGITVQTGGVNLPVGTEVSIELKMQGMSLRANIAALRAKNAEAKTAQEIARPAAPTSAPETQGAPPRPGDRLLALRLPEEAPTPAARPAAENDAPTPAQRPTLEQAARIIEAVRATTGVARMAMMLPPVPDVPLPVIWQVLNTREVMAALVRLPETMQARLQDFLTRPDVAAALRHILPPAQAHALLPPAPTPAEAQDLTQAQMALRTAPPPGPSSAMPAGPLTGGLMGLLPMLDGMMPAGAASLMMLGGKLPNMVPGAQNLPLPQNMVQITIEDFMPPQGAAAASRPAGSTVATVEALTASGAPVLKTAEAYFVLQQSVPLPVGTQLIVTIAPAQPQDILADAAVRAGTVFDPLFGRGWPALEEALGLLNAGSAQIAQALAQTIPAATARLAPTTLFFLAALRMGNIESWLGPPALEALRSGGRRDIAERLTQDFAKLAALSKTAIAGEWRAISMPLLQQDQHIHLIQLFLRQPPPDDHESGEEAAENRRKTTRFILNLHLSRMGDMQLDGFVQQKRFDLILRTENKLPGDIRQELLAKFTTGLEQTGMDGSMRFQTRAEQWVVVPTGTESGTQA